MAGTTLVITSTSAENRQASHRSKPHPSFRGRIQPLAVDSVKFRLQKRFDHANDREPAAVTVN